MLLMASWNQNRHILPSPHNKHQQNAIIVMSTPRLKICVDQIKKGMMTWASVASSGSRPLILTGPFVPCQHQTTQPFSSFPCRPHRHQHRPQHRHKHCHQHRHHQRHHQRHYIVNIIINRPRQHCRRQKARTPRLLPVLLCASGKWIPQPSRLG